MSNRALFGALALAASAIVACGLVAGIEDIPEGASGPSDASDATVGEDAGKLADGALPECGAQRVVHLVAGQGGLAWFTQIWAVPQVVTTTVATYAIDDRTRFVSGGSSSHPLYTRTLSGSPLWTGSGKNPKVTAFFAGTNETHVDNPTSTLTLRTGTVLGQAALAQKKLAPRVPVLLFDNTTYMAAAGGPSAVTVVDVAAAVTAMKQAANLDAAAEAAIRPDPAKAASWHSPSAPLTIKNLAEQLLFSAHVLERGLVGTIAIPALRDDPHQAFANGAGPVTLMADDLAKVLAGFYTELATSFEATCGHSGQPLSLADNVVLIVSGDTPKDPFDSKDWPDKTPGSANVLYVRSNGWLKAGWFGQVSPTTRTNFDPTTGELSTTALQQESNAAMIDATLYAISSGDSAFVTAFDPRPYAGLRATLTP